MAKVNGNIVTANMSGQVAKQLVFIQKNGKTIVCKYPNRSGKISAKQQAQQDKFALGVVYAKNAMLNSTLKDSYTAEAAKRKGVTAYNLALADYLKAPEIGKVNISGYTGDSSGERITIEVKDTFKVVSVKVKIVKANNDLVEEGAAVLNEGKWVYTSTSSNANPTGGKVMITAADRPGNVTNYELTI